MTLRIEDYALIGNCETCALVGTNGSIDWLGLPRFDSPACFAALLGTPENGSWQIAPTNPGSTSTRRYRGDTLILETTFSTSTGAVVVIDFMTRRDGATDLVRLVRGLHGSVAMRSDLAARFDYGLVVPWASRRPDGLLQLVAGPERLVMDTDVELHGEDMRTVGEFEIQAGQTRDLS